MHHVSVREGRLFVAQWAVFFQVHLVAPLVISALDPFGVWLSSVALQLDLDSIGVGRFQSWRYLCGPLSNRCSLEEMCSWAICEGIVRFPNSSDSDLGKCKRSR